MLVDELLLLRVLNDVDDAALKQAIENSERRDLDVLAHVDVNDL